MFGAFRPTGFALGGKFWKRRWHASQNQKRRIRSRMRAVDGVVNSLTDTGMYTRRVDAISTRMPQESNMDPKDKYTIFSRYRGDRNTYRMPIHLAPAFTKLTSRKNPVGL